MHTLFILFFLGVWFVSIVVPIYCHIPDNLPTPEVSVHFSSFKNILKMLCQDGLMSTYQLAWLSYLV